jgi:hypothetical protein
MFPIGPCGNPDFDRASTFADIVRHPHADGPPPPCGPRPTQYCVIGMTESIAGRIVSIHDRQYERTQ